ncbi:Transposase and inactivated derivatives, IS30 family [Butyrivibrio hungatei]|uniref:Transposase and inactivated derivatives, IS30 family n=1 Tax=Butyrivibrio hungatei TaxID=185008 RepID=A0A1G5G0H7_9FIRM|nr:IS30 family transposase [Butyrivibrio hungatei]SCY44787.1 Transposase and inactivated derivatives, IS30 family [Butyrivibrio hungatei]
MSGYKHLTHEQRVLVEDRLNHKTSIRKIALELEKAPSTVLREIRNHSLFVPTIENDCKHKRNCNLKNVCGDALCSNKCYTCHSKCTKHCDCYEKALCPKLETSPYVCNGCKKINGLCTYDKTVYYAIDAQKKYKSLLTSTRSGFDISEQELEKINTLASPLIINGLSPYHIKQTYADEITISEATLRRMIDKNALDAKNIDLRDKVKRKPRKHSEISPLSTAKVGHFYGDYLKYIEENDVCVTEMDCVEGKKGENVALLTLTIPSLSLQLAFIMEYQNSSCVVEALDMIETALGTELFSQVFPLILTDNGSEFSDIKGMETSCITGSKRTSIFFCEPNRSDEKGSCENHHKMIRYIIPKGASLEPYVQADISLMMNHINSYKRKALFGKSAFDLATAVLPMDFFILLGLEIIPPNEIILRPSLLK